MSHVDVQLVRIGHILKFLSWPGCDNERYCREMSSCQNIITYSSRYTISPNHSVHKWKFTLLTKSFLAPCPVRRHPAAPVISGTATFCAASPWRLRALSTPVRLTELQLAQSLPHRLVCSFRGYRWLALVCCTIFTTLFPVCNNVPERFGRSIWSFLKRTNFFAIVHLISGKYRWLDIKTKATNQNTLLLGYANDHTTPQQ